MSVHLTLKIDRQMGRPSDNGTIYYPVSEIFWHSCQAAGDDLVVDAQIESLYDEVDINYPSSRVVLERQDGQPMVGLFLKI